MLPFELPPFVGRLHARPVSDIVQLRSEEQRTKIHFVSIEIGVVTKMRIVSLARQIW